MKKKLILFMGLLVFLTGCQETNSNSNQSINIEGENSTTTSTTTTTMKASEEDIEENKTTSTTSTTSTTVKATSNQATTTKGGTTTTTKKGNTTTTSKGGTTTTTKSSTTTTTTKATTTKTTTKGTTTKQQLTEKDVYNAMIALQSKYPTGTPWDNSNFYAWKGGAGYSGGYGCAGFAFMLSDAAFGNTPAKKVTSFDNIRVGDIIRLYNDTHSVIVLAIKGDKYTIAEGNMNSATYWGRVITLSEIKSTGNYILTRW